MTLINKACYERGCACYDDRVDEDAVEVVLAQKQEPIAMLFGSLPVYDRTTPPQRTWVGLTDEEVSEVFGGDIHAEHSGELRFVRAIEAKLKEKNK